MKRIVRVLPYILFFVLVYLGVYYFVDGLGFAVALPHPEVFSQAAVCLVGARLVYTRILFKEK